MELPTEKLSSGALGFGLCHRWKCEESFQEATTRRLQFLFMSLYLELGKKIGLPQPPKLKSWKGKKELISPIQFDDSPNYKLHLVPGFALATFDYTGLPMLIYKPIYSTSQKKKKHISTVDSSEMFLPFFPGKDRTACTGSQPTGAFIFRFSRVSFSIVARCLRMVPGGSKKSADRSIGDGAMGRFFKMADAKIKGKIWEKMGKSSN